MYQSITAFCGFTSSNSDQLLLAISFTQGMMLRRMRCVSCSMSHTSLAVMKE